MSGPGPGWYTGDMKIAIAGYGVEGRSNLAYFRRRFPDADYIIADQQPVADPPAGVTVRTGPEVFARQLGDADMVVRTAGLPPRAIVTSGTVWSASNEFFATCPAPIIGVTGSKGKGTTCSLIAAILRAAGRTVHLVGNIGLPGLDVLPQITPDDVVVYELSSFQLWDLQRSPQVAVVLMVEPEHLDVHRDLDEYLTAKVQIVRHQTAQDSLIYHPSNPYTARIVAGARARACRYGVAEDGAVYIHMNKFFVQGRAICDTAALRLPGRHNLDNACAAMSAVYALDPTVPDQAVAEGLASFSGLPHRLKFVDEVRGVRFYDDSIATTPGSASAALRAFRQPTLLILGGHDKGADYSDLARDLARADHLRGVVLIGHNAPRLAAALAQAGLPDNKLTQTGLAPMPAIVQAANTMARPGDVVILSPAAASFGMFDNYVDRGQQFVRAVQALGSATMAAPADHNA